MGAELLYGIRICKLALAVSIWSVPLFWQTIFNITDHEGQPNCQEQTEDQTEAHLELPDSSRRQGGRFYWPNDLRTMWAFSNPDIARLNPCLFDISWSCNIHLIFPSQPSDVVWYNTLRTSWIFNDMHNYFVSHIQCLLVWSSNQRCYGRCSSIGLTKRDGVGRSSRRHPWSTLPDCLKSSVVLNIIIILKCIAMQTIISG